MANPQYLSSGSFGKKLLMYNFLPSLHKNDIFFYLHGVYSSGFSDKNQALFTKIVNDLGGVFYYETSRDLYVTKKENKGLEFDKYLLTFEGKKFTDELEDVLKIFDEFYVNYAKNCNRIHLIGSSLGGTISSYLISKYGDKIVSITLLGSGISTKGVNRPITSTYPNSQQILDNFSKFRGNLVLVQGTADDVVPREAARKIIDIAKMAKNKKLVELEGVDHTFTMRNGIKDPDILSKEVFEIIKGQIS